MARIRIQLLGGFALYDRCGTQLHLPSRNAAAVLTVLAVGRGRMQNRAKLASLLWDVFDFEHARGSLRQTLYMLRRTLGREAFLEQTDALRLDEASVQVDLWDLTQLLVDDGQPDLFRILDLYQGELLEGQPNGRGFAFEDWLNTERQRLHDVVLQALGSALHHALNRGAHEEARQVASRMLAIDPAEEVAHRALMQVHASHQHFGQALRQFERCRRILRSELNVEPDTETQRLHADIIRSRQSRSFPEASEEFSITGLRHSA